jgi:hypothetical protein
VKGGGGPSWGGGGGEAGQHDSLGWEKTKGRLGRLDWFGPEKEI